MPHNVAYLQSFPHNFFAPTGYWAHYEGTMPQKQDGRSRFVRTRGASMIPAVLMVGLLGVVATVLVDDQFVIPAEVNMSQVAAATTIEGVASESCTVTETTTIPSMWVFTNVQRVVKYGKFCTPQVIGGPQGTEVATNCVPDKRVPAGRCWVKVCDPLSDSKSCKVLNTAKITGYSWNFNSSKEYNEWVDGFKDKEFADVVPNATSLLSDNQLTQALGCAYGVCTGTSYGGVDEVGFEPTPPVYDTSDACALVPECASQNSTQPIDQPTGSLPPVQGLDDPKLNFNYATCAQDPTLPQCRDARWGFESPDNGGKDNFCPPGQTWNGTACAAGDPKAPYAQASYTPAPYAQASYTPNPPDPTQTPNPNAQNPLSSLGQMLGQLLGKALTGNNCPAGQAPIQQQPQQQYTYQYNQSGQLVAIPVVQQPQNNGIFGNLFGGGLGGGQQNCAPQSGTGGGITQPPLPVQAQLSCSPKKAGIGSKIALTFACTNAQSGVGKGFSTGSALSGSTEVTIATSTLDADGKTMTYGLECSGTGGMQRATCEVSVAVNPTIVLIAIPKEVKSGETASIGWIATGMSACKISSPQLLEFTTANENISLVEGIAKTTAISTTTDVFLKCTTLGGAAKESKVTVTVQN